MPRHSRKMKTDMYRRLKFRSNLKLHNVVHTSQRDDMDDFGWKRDRIFNWKRPQANKPEVLFRMDLVSAMMMAEHESVPPEDCLVIRDHWKEEWEKGVQVPLNPHSFPCSTVEPLDRSQLAESKCSFRIWNDNVKQPLNDNTFHLPDIPITFEDLSLATYELDTQDICWLSALHDSKLNLKIPDTLFADVICQIELQCASLIKEEQVGIEYDEHTFCDVCQSPDVEDDNEMIFCDLCNVCVHQFCYGVSTIPSGEWLCNACRDLGSSRSCCVLCPNSGGALKPTTTPNKWAHVSCANWIPEAKFLNFSLLEPIELKAIPEHRWNQPCCLCNSRRGVPIMCEEKNCRTTYHVTCAFHHGLKMTVFWGDDNTAFKLKSYCLLHSQYPTSESSISAPEGDFSYVSMEKPEGFVNPYSKFWNYVDIEAVLQEVTAKFIIDFRTEHGVEPELPIDRTLMRRMVSLIYQYWIMKRIENGGNPLIKLFPKTTYEDLVKGKLQDMYNMRFYLEKLRTITYMTFRREKAKEQWVRNQMEIAQKALHLLAHVPTDVEYTDSTNENDHSESEQFKQRKHKLFKQILCQGDIYPFKDESLNSTETSETSTNANVSNDTSNSSSTAANNNTSTNCMRKKVFNRDMTTHILKSLKRLFPTRPQHSMKDRPNPYAKVYLNGGHSRGSSKEAIKVETKPLSIDVSSHSSMNQSVQSDSKADIPSLNAVQSSTSHKRIRSHSPVFQNCQTNLRSKTSTCEEAVDNNHSVEEDYSQNHCTKRHSLRLNHVKDSEQVQPNVPEKSTKKRNGNGGPQKENKTSHRILTRRQSSSDVHLENHMHDHESATSKFAALMPVEQVNFASDPPASDGLERLNSLRARHGRQEVLKLKNSLTAQIRYRFRDVPYRQQNKPKCYPATHRNRPSRQIS